MKLELEINNTTQSPVADGFLQKVAEETFVELNLEASLPSVSISLALVSPEEIQKINKEHRQKDSVTDVLSFAEYEDISEIKKAVNNPPEDGQEKLFLGELILCYDDIREYAKKEGIKLEKELANVVSHGILHLLGFKHGEEMFKLQEQIKNKF